MGRQTATKSNLGRSLLLFQMSIIDHGFAAMYSEGSELVNQPSLGGPDTRYSTQAVCKIKGKKNKKAAGTRDERSGR